MENKKVKTLITDALHLGEKRGPFWVSQFLLKYPKMLSTIYLTNDKNFAPELIREYLDHLVTNPENTEAGRIVKKKLLPYVKDMTWPPTEIVHNACLFTSRLGSLGISSLLGAFSDYFKQSYETFPIVGFAPDCFQDFELNEPLGRTATKPAYSDGNSEKHETTAFEHEMNTLYIDRIYNYMKKGYLMKDHDEWHLAAKGAYRHLAETLDVEDSVEGEILREAKKCMEFTDAYDRDDIPPDEKFTEDDAFIAGKDRIILLADSCSPDSYLKNFPGPHPPLMKRVRVTLQRKVSKIYQIDRYPKWTGRRVSESFPDPNDLGPIIGGPGTFPGSDGPIIGGPGTFPVSSPEPEPTTPLEPEPTTPLEPGPEPTSPIMSSPEPHPPGHTGPHFPGPIIDDMLLPGMDIWRLQLQMHAGFLTFGDTFSEKSPNTALEIVLEVDVEYGEDGGYSGGKKKHGGKTEPGVMCLSDDHEHMEEFHEDEIKDSEEHEKKKTENPKSAFMINKKDKDMCFSNTFGENVVEDFRMSASYSFNMYIDPHMDLVTAFIPYEDRIKSQSNQETFDEKKEFLKEKMEKVKKMKDDYRESLPTWEEKMKFDTISAAIFTAKNSFDMSNWGSKEEERLLTWAQQQDWKMKLVKEENSESGWKRNEKTAREQHQQIDPGFYDLMKDFKKAHGDFNINDIGGNIKIQTPEEIQTDFAISNICMNIINSNACAPFVDTDFPEFGDKESCMAYYKEQMSLKNFALNPSEKCQKNAPGMWGRVGNNLQCRNSISMIHVGPDSYQKYPYYWCKFLRFNEPSEYVKKKMINTITTNLLDVMNNPDPMTPKYQTRDTYAWERCSEEECDAGLDFLTQNQGVDAYAKSLDDRITARRSLYESRSPTVGSADSTRDSRDSRDSSLQQKNDYGQQQNGKTRRQLSGRTQKYAENFTNVMAMWGEVLADWATLGYRGLGLGCLTFPDSGDGKKIKESAPYKYAYAFPGNFIQPGWVRKNVGCMSRTFTREKMESVSGETIYKVTKLSAPQNREKYEEVCIHYPKEQSVYADSEYSDMQSHQYEWTFSYPEKTDPTDPKTPANTHHLEVELKEYTPAQTAQSDFEFVETKIGKQKLDSLGMPYESVRIETPATFGWTTESPFLEALLP